MTSFLGISSCLVLKLASICISFTLWLLDFYFWIGRRKSYKQYAGFECTPFPYNISAFPPTWVGFVKLAWLIWASSTQLLEEDISLSGEELPYDKKLDELNGIDIKQFRLDLDWYFFYG